MQQADKLNVQGRMLQLPFDLKLTGELEPIICQQLLRIVPGKRLVIAGLWRAQKVVIKLFLDKKRGAHHAQRETRGIEFLEKASLLTATCLASGEVEDGSIHAVILQHMDGMGCYDYWQKCLIDAEKRSIIKMLVKTVLQMHEKNLLQQDLHPNNFLWQNGQVVILDASEIVHVEKKLNVLNSLDNVSLLMAQFPLPVHDWLEESITVALGEDEKESAQSKAYLIKRLQYWRDYRVQRYLKKTLRDCSAFRCEKTARQFLVCDRQFDKHGLQALLQDPDQSLVWPGSQILKAGNASTVWQVNVDGQAVVIKRYNYRSWWHKLKSMFQPGRAVRCWQNAQRLTKLGIATAKPIALYIKRWGPIQRVAYVISEHIEGERVRELFVDEPASCLQPEEKAAALVQLIKQLAKAGIVHGDMKSSNFIFMKDKPVLIDLDSMYKAKRRFSFKRGFSRDLKRFMRNWKDEAIKQLYRRLLQENNLYQFVAKS